MSIIDTLRTMTITIKPLGTSGHYAIRGSRDGRLLHTDSVEIFVLKGIERAAEKESQRTGLAVVEESWGIGRRGLTVSSSVADEVAELLHELSIPCVREG